MAPRVIFRCDASPVIGAGHVMRCLALAEAMADTGWHVGFVVGHETLDTVPAVAGSGFDVRMLGDVGHEIEAIADASGGHTDLLVIDHYGRDAVFEGDCRSYVKKILVFDDATGRDHDCDLLVDAAATDLTLYRTHVPVHTRVLSGSKFAVIRKCLLARRAAALARRDGSPVREILVSCGATDPANATAIVLDALDDVACDVTITVALSSRAPHLDAIGSRLRGNMRLVIDSDDMAGLMTQADLAVGAAGGTAWERCCLGLPSVLVTLADNQRSIARLLAATSAAFYAGGIEEDCAPRLRGLVERLLVDGEARVRLAHAASTLVDGRGPQRIVLEMLDEVRARHGASVRLRLAEAADAGWLLSLQSQPQTRQYFRNPAVPSMEEHHRWVQQTLADPEKLLCIIEVGGERAGIVRLDRLPDHEGAPRYEVAIAVDSACYRRGIGSAALWLVRRLVNGAVLDAAILPENSASKAIFMSNGYIALSGDVYRSYPARSVS